MNVLITGSSGYFGQNLTRFLTSHGYSCFGADLIDCKDENLKEFLKINLLDIDQLRQFFIKNKFNKIIHLASQIDFAVSSQESLYKNNLGITKNILMLALEFNIEKIIFTSSNSVYLGNKGELLTEETIPKPRDKYGLSKLDSEKLLIEKSNSIDVNIIRCPNIIDAGRVGMLSILFDLLDVGGTLWVLRGGEIKHQTIYADDLCLAIKKLLLLKGSTIHNIGCDEVLSFREIFLYLIKISNSKSKVRNLSALIAVPLLKIFYLLKISPLGPYQFRMLTNDFIFQNSKIKKDLNWAPTKNNAEILAIAYDYYLRQKDKRVLENSANSGKVKMGILSILKLIRF
jgi:UDP-glucose 4-epimerase